MASGESERKHGTALTDKVREERRKLQDETREVLRRYRDSIDLETDEGPRVIVNVSPRKSIIDSLRPRRSHSSNPPTAEELAHIKKKVTRWIMIVIAAGGGAVAALRAVGVIK